ncbi:MAG: GAF domain-containing protein [Desulfobacterales bacterium]|nr:GAF domain-containing protein [Desulfobacterales bacterium]
MTSSVIESRQALLINQNFQQRYSELRGHQVADRLPKSWLGVPILRRDEVRGVISLQNFDQENAFSAADVRLLTTMSASMWVAIENASIFESIEQRVEERTRQLAKEVDENARLVQEAQAAQKKLESANALKSQFLGKYVPRAAHAAEFH